jgi:hypothetical protein
VVGVFFPDLSNRLTRLLFSRLAQKPGLKQLTLFGCFEAAFVNIKVGLEGFLFFSSGSLTPVVAQAAAPSLQFNASPITLMPSFK